MSNHYTDADVQAALSALLGFEPHPTTHDAWSASVIRVLAAVAPAIAARTLREAADKLAGASPSPKFAPGWLAAEMGLRARAADIEAQP